MGNLSYDLWMREALNRAKKNAGRRKLEFCLQLHNIAAMAQRADGRCELTGVPFNFVFGRASRRPFAPSIDRIESSEGYRPSNCRLVCAAANIAMNEWGEAVLAQLAVGYAAQKGWLIRENINNVLEYQHRRP